jgi:hypothetical protein
MKENLNTTKKEKNTKKNNKPTASKKKPSEMNKKQKKSLLEVNKIEDSILNDTPIVYNTTKCTVPSSVVLENKLPKLSLWERFVNFIINL